MWQLSNQRLQINHPESCCLQISALWIFKYSETSELFTDALRFIMSGINPGWIYHGSNIQRKMFFWCLYFMILGFIFKQPFQALHKKILTTTACALLNILARGRSITSHIRSSQWLHTPLQDSETSERNQLEIMTLSGDYWFSPWPESHTSESGFLPPKAHLVIRPPKTIKLKIIIKLKPLRKQWHHKSAQPNVSN